MPTRILFVCLGNICRSPLAEGVFIHLARERGVADRFIVDSAGTGHWHIGELPDPRARAVAQNNGVELPSRARQVDAARDLVEPDDSGGDSGHGWHWLIGMDRSNCANLIRLGAPRERVRLLRSFDPQLAGRPDSELEVPDPYQEADEAFDEVFGMVKRACAGMLERFTHSTTA